MKLTYLAQGAAVVGTLLAGALGAWFVTSNRWQPPEAAAHGHAEEHVEHEDEHGDTDEHGHGADEHDHGADEHGHTEEGGHEDRTEIVDVRAEQAGVVTEIAGAGVIAEVLETTGFVETDPARVAHVVPRYVGTVQELRVHVGEQVAAGQTLARVANRSTGVEFDVVAPLDGTVLEIGLRPGEIASETSDILIADLSEVWAQVRIFSRDRSRVEMGQKVRIATLDGSPDATGALSWISPVVSPETQAQLGRVVLDNSAGWWSPGMAVNAAIELSNFEVPVAVERTALQVFEGGTVVFVKSGEAYEARRVELGRQNGEMVEIVSGLKPGETYVSENSFLIKADLLKSGAAHAH